MIMQLTVIPRGIPLNSPVDRPYILLPSHPAKWFFRHLAEYEIWIWHIQNKIPQQLSKTSSSEQSQVLYILNKEEIMFERREDPLFGLIYHLRAVLTVNTVLSICCGGIYFVSACLDFEHNHAFVYSKLLVFFIIVD